jgi:hypothetical protein
VQELQLLAQSSSELSTSGPIQPLAVEYFSIVMIINKKGRIAIIEKIPHEMRPPIKSNMAAAEKNDNPMIAIILPVTT